MIGSFWNLCRACPSMPVDKLHSEYRSTYRWHEYTGPRQEVVRRPPQPNPVAPSTVGERHNELQNSKCARDEEGQNEMPKMEPALPRRKKHPELAYRHHEFLGSSDVKESISCDRARSEERGGSHWRPSRRSKSEGPARCPNVGVDVDAERRRESDPDIENTGRNSGLLRKAISKLSTEYRLQFAWPQGHVSRRDHVDAATTPRKSLSMGALKPPPNSIVHKKRIDHENRDASELEPLVNDHTVNEDSREDKVHFRTDIKTEYKKKFRPFSQYEYSEGRFTDRCPENKQSELSNAKLIDNNESWYGEVVELRKKAGEYKHRGWGTEFAPERLTDLYNKQIELWDQVSQRSSLSALSLASTTHRSYTKEEKEQENNKRSSPNKQSYYSARSTKDMVRHHLERTTGGSELDGLILSPTREKLEPTIPRKDDDFRGSQRGSPQKHSPQKGSPQKSANQKRSSQKARNSLKSARSQSVGPNDMGSEKKSPKRQSRSATVKEKRSASNSASATRRPRPSSLNTTPALRSKCSSVPCKNEDDRLAKPKSNKIQSSSDTSTKETRKQAGDKSKSEDVPATSEPDTVDLEPVVKSPPEPTRVKSPEQIMMRSPDPVNWTVPLDTGKTFTVTQNIREGELGTRPHSEVKAWTPPDLPPPPAQSAPPQLPVQIREQVRKPTNCRSNTTALRKKLSAASSSEIGVIVEIENQEANSALSQTDKSTIPSHCLTDSSLEASTAIIITVTQPCESNISTPNRKSKTFPPIVSIQSPNEQSYVTTDVFEKARDRFDRFWSNISKEET